MGERQCVGCGKKAEKSALVRVVRKPDGTVVADSTGRLSGRGTYVCSVACLTQASKKAKLARALKVSSDGVYWEGIAIDVASIFAGRVDKGVM